MLVWIFVSLFVLSCCLFFFFFFGDDDSGGSGNSHFPARLHNDGIISFFSPAGVVAQHFNITLYPAHVSSLVSSVNNSYAFSAHAFDSWGYLAGSDIDRAADVVEGFANNSISMLLANRGGYGCTRLLQLIDYSKLSRKIIMGYSDLTALLNAIHTKTGLVTFHGPMGIDNWGPLSIEYISRVLKLGESVVFANPPSAPTRTVTTGKARGGNLSVFAALLGSEFLPGDFSDYILFLEDVGEKPYSIDRILTSLSTAGILMQIKAFVFGTCSGCTASPPSFTLEEVIDQHIKPLGIPAYQGALFGHSMSEQFVLPIGVRVEVDADAATIALLEPAVQ